MRARCGGPQGHPHQHNARFESSGEVIYAGPFFFYAVGNARHRGAGTPVTPHADYSDAQLDGEPLRGRDFRYRLLDQTITVLHK